MGKLRLAVRMRSQNAGLLQSVGFSIYFHGFGIASPDRNSSSLGPGIGLPSSADGIGLVEPQRFDSACLQSLDYWSRLEPHLITPIKTSWQVEAHAELNDPDTMEKVQLWPRVDLLSRLEPASSAPIFPFLFVNFSKLWQSAWDHKNQNGTSSIHRVFPLIGHWFSRLECREYRKLKLVNENSEFPF